MAGLWLQGCGGRCLVKGVKRRGVVWGGGGGGLTVSFIIRRRSGLSIALRSILTRLGRFLFFPRCSLTGDSSSSMAGGSAVEVSSLLAGTCQSNPSSQM